MISPLQPSMRVADSDGSISEFFKRWLDAMARTVAGPIVGDMLSNTTVVRANQFAIHAGDLILAGNSEVILESGSILVVL